MNNSNPSCRDCNEITREDTDNVLSQLQSALSTSEGIHFSALSSAVKLIRSLTDRSQAESTRIAAVSGEVVEVGNIDGGDIPGVTLRRPFGFLSILGLTEDEARSVANFYGRDVAVTISLGDNGESQADLFCDSNCVWTDHHPECKNGQVQPESKTKKDTAKSINIDLLNCISDAIHRVTGFPNIKGNEGRYLLEELVSSISSQPRFNAQTLAKNSEAIDRIEFAILPVNPTLEMIEAGARYGVDGDFDSDLSNGTKELSRKIVGGIYAAMRKAAPADPFSIPASEDILLPPAAP